MDLIKLIDQNVECVATPNGRYLKRSEVFEIVEKFTSNNKQKVKCKYSTHDATWFSRNGCKFCPECGVKL